MTDDDDTPRDMPNEAQSVHAARPPFYTGPRALGALLSGITRPVFKKQSPASAQIILDWETIVGPKIAGMTVPRKLDRGVLTIACSGPTAMNLHYVGVELINRINTHLGGQPVHSLRFTQAGAPKAARQGFAAPPEAVLEAEVATAALPEGKLREALTGLGRVVLGRAKHAKRSS